MSDCENTSVGLTPILDLTGTYQTYAGYLYPSSNTMPTGHATQFATAKSNCVRRDTDGNPSGSGSIVFISIGMSNTYQEFDVFRVLAASVKASYVTIVNGAQTNRDASAWADSESDTWTTLASRITATGKTAEQVGWVWLKLAEAGVTGSFPTHVETFQGYLKAVVQEIATRFPNCKGVSISPRLYGGYASVSTQSPAEPWSYEEGFGVKWLIEDQINYATTGDPDLDYALVPWLGWGPYLWADGTTENSEGTYWECADFEEDGIHPEEGAENRVAQMLLDYMEDFDWFVGITAIELTAHVAEQSPTDSASYVSVASWTPTANALQIIITNSSLGATPNVPSLSGHGLTYELITTRTYGVTTPNNRLSIFMAIGASPTTGQLTATFGGQTQLQFTFSAFELTGIDTDNPVPQYEENAGDSINTLDTTLPSGQSASGSIVIGAAANTSSTGFTPDEGWTEIHDIESTGPYRRLETQWNSSFDQTLTAQLTGGGSANMGAIIIEVIPTTSSSPSSSYTTPAFFSGIHI